MYPEMLDFFPNPLKLLIKNGYIKMNFYAKRDFNFSPSAKKNAGDVMKVYVHHRNEMIMSRRVKKERLLHKMAAELLRLPAFIIIIIITIRIKFSSFYKIAFHYPKIG